MGVSSGGGVRGIDADTGVGSGVGKAPRLLLKLVSTGVGRKRLVFFSAKSVRSPGAPLAPFGRFSSFLSCLLLRIVVSTGSGANRRTFFTDSSIGVDWKCLLEGAGDVSVIVPALPRRIDE